MKRDILIAVLALLLVGCGLSEGEARKEIVEKDVENQTTTNTPILTQTRWRELTQSRFSVCCLRFGELSASLPSPLMLKLSKIGWLLLFSTAPNNFV